MATYHNKIIGVSGKNNARGTVGFFRYICRSKLNEHECIHSADLGVPHGITAEQFWRASDKNERGVRHDAQLYRMQTLSLPAELDEEQMQKLVRGYALGIRDHLKDDQGYKPAITFAIHKPSNDSDSRHYHAHLIIGTRGIDAQGNFSKKKYRHLNGPEGSKTVSKLRKNWETRVNTALERAGETARVDCRSKRAVARARGNDMSEYRRNVASPQQVKALRNNERGVNQSAQMVQMGWDLETQNRKIETANERIREHNRTATRANRAIERQDRAISRDQLNAELTPRQGRERLAGARVITALGHPRATGANQDEERKRRRQSARKLEITRRRRMVRSRFISRDLGKRTEGNDQGSEPMHRRSAMRDTADNRNERHNPQRGTAPDGERADLGASGDDRRPERAPERAPAEKTGVSEQHRQPLPLTAEEREYDSILRKTAVWTIQDERKVRHQTDVARWMRTKPEKPKLSLWDKLTKKAEIESKYASELTKWELEKPHKPRMHVTQAEQKQRAEKYRADAERDVFASEEIEEFYEQHIMPAPDYEPDNVPEETEDIEWEFGEVRDFRGSVSQRTSRFRR